MLKSMTGFGQCEITTEEYKISVEMKAVNHRYLDLSIKMPKKFNFFEAGIQKPAEEVYPARARWICLFPMRITPKAGCL